MKKAAALFVLALALHQTAQAGAAFVFGDGPHPFPTETFGYPKSVAIQKALQLCRERGGVNPKVLAATDRLGYGAVATAALPSGHGTFVKCELGKKTKAEAEGLAMASCIRAGGVNVQVIRSFRDSGTSGDVFSQETYLRASDLMIQRRLAKHRADSKE